MTKRKPASAGSLNVAVVGHFQVGKSTLVNCLLRKRAAKCGDTTWATTARTKPYRLGHLTLLDTHGINAEEEHDKEMEKGIQRADLVLLVVSSQLALSTPLIGLVSRIARMRIPFFTVINCWDDKNWSDGDPETVGGNKVVSAIVSQLRMVSSPLGTGIVNVEWAAAARGCLVDEARAGKLLRENQDARTLEQRSRLSQLEDFLFPDPLSAFSPEGLECAALTSKFIRRFSKEP
jgi:tRNA U34 5-carboxymethylaminomethyl modifying GTPase MnmE/TrmE